MFAARRCIAALYLILSPVFAFALGEWQPTPDELKMTSYAPDPNAPAVILFREETVDDNIHIHTVYTRVKILSEKGKEMFGDIVIPYDAKFANIRGVSGRTIHSDGTVIPFTGKPYDKLVEKSADYKVMEKVFSMPDVQVGSILEFKWTLGYPDDYLSPPEWIIQQSVPVVKAHYRFVPNGMFFRGSMTVTSKEQGHENVAYILLYWYILPTGDTVKENVDHAYEVSVENIPATPHEDSMPAFRSLVDRVTFYYSPFATPAEYWKKEGKYWSKDFDRFANPSSAIRSAVNGIVAPGDTDQQKVQKIYAAMMKLENTSFTREHSTEENKEEGLKIKTADDIWMQKRGSDDQITRLFVAMIRAAGLKAYGATVVDRDTNIFEGNFLSFRQLDDELAIVVIDGKEVFFDPGQRYCDFSKLSWKHTAAGGIRQTGDGTQIFSTPPPEYKENSLSRTAQLTLDPEGHVSGRVLYTMTGAEALHWRQASLTSDEADVKKQFEKEHQPSMPPGVLISVDHFVGLTDYTAPLMAVMNASGTLGTQTGKHVFLPAVFFEAGNSSRFAEAQRENPIDLHFPYMVHDEFNLTLPPNLTVQSLPSNSDVPFLPNGDCIAKFVSKGNIVAYGRLFRLAESLYPASDYSGLRGFYQKVSTQDHEQIALKIVPVAAAAATSAAVPTGK